MRKTEVEKGEEIWRWSQDKSQGMFHDLRHRPRPWASPYIACFLPIHPIWWRVGPSPFNDSCAIRSNGWFPVFTLCNLWSGPGYPGFLLSLTIPSSRKDFVYKSSKTSPANPFMFLSHQLTRAVTVHWFMSFPWLITAFPTRLQAYWGWDHVQFFPSW